MVYHIKLYFFEETIEGGVLSKRKKKGKTSRGSKQKSINLDQKDFSNTPIFDTVYEMT